MQIFLEATIIPYPLVKIILHSNFVPGDREIERMRGKIDPEQKGKKQKGEDRALKLSHLLHQFAFIQYIFYSKLTKHTKFASPKPAF